jgi:predicted RNA-binding protein Jag
VSAPLPTGEETARVLGELFSLMGYGAKLDVKDAEDGSISVAVTLDAELPSHQGGRRSSVMEAVQYLVNKRLNRAPDVRRWINLGLGEHPAPRSPRPPRPSPQAASPAAAPAQQPAPASSPVAGPVAAPAPRPAAAAPRAPARPSALDEAKLEVTPDEALSSAARALAEASARLGRTYALVGMTAEDRARVVQAVKGTPGVTVKAEGDGRNRRVALLPDKPTPMPRQRLPGLDDDAFADLDDDDDEAEDEG